MDSFMETKFQTLAPAEGSLPEEHDFAGEHMIAAFVGKPAGPTLIAVGSLHGNEPGGALALSNVAKKLAGLSDKLKGRVYFLVGNTRARAAGVRFIDHDLNRVWTASKLSSERAVTMTNSSERAELREMDAILDGLLITAMDEVFVLDLHSTSTGGMPFATVGDTLRNRTFAQKFPVAILLGIEEQLEGTMLEYLNNAGAVTLGFEGGQHFGPETAANHESLVWLGLVNAGILNAADVPDLDVHKKRLAKQHGKARVFEVRHRHAITAEDDFLMKTGFANFDPVKKGEHLGSDRNGEVSAVESGLLLMPLYQKLGEDGFFIGREISPFWLALSGLIRRIGVQKFVHWLPGVARDEHDPGTLIVNTSVARLFPLQVFHLLGFRRRRWAGKKLIVSRRRHDTTGPFKWKAN
jgi:predicted deacylase